MTNSEAIEVLKANYPDPCFELLRDAVDTAIYALSAQPEQIARDIATIIENEQDMRVVLKNAEVETQMSLADCISRQAAIDALGEKPLGDTDWDLGCRNQWEWDTEILKTMPSAQPERKIGQWVGTEFDGYADGNPVYYEWKCSNCGCIFEDEEPMYNYCPNCGAEMKGEDDATD